MTFKVKDGLSVAGNTIIDGFGNVTVPGKTTTSNTTASGASLNLGTGTADPTTPAAGDFWYNTGAIKVRQAAATKVVAYTDSTITGNAANVTGTVAIANGGTNTNTTPTAGAITYGTGTAYAFTAAGTAGQVLTSAAASAPTWTTSSSSNTASAVVQRDSSGNFSAGTITASLTGTASNATNLAITDDTTTNATYYPAFAITSVAGNVAHRVSSTKLTFNPSTGLLSATGFAGNGSALTNLDAADISAGTLPIARGGTNGSAAPTAGGIAYGTGTAYAFSAAGTAGQVLTSAASGAPLWANPSETAVGTAVNATNATNATNVNITSETVSAANHYLHFGTATTGYDAVKISASGVLFQPSTGKLTVGGDLLVGGNLTINGTTNTVNSTIVTIDDPVFTLGGDVAPATDDNKDRGIEFRWHNGTAAKVGFFGFNDLTGKFTFIPDAANASEVFSGTKGTLDASLEWADVLNKPDPVVTVTLTGDVTGTGNVTLTDVGSGTISFATTIAANSVALGTDTTGDYVASIADGTSGVQSGTSGLTISATAGEGTAATIAHADTSTLSGQQGTAGIANFTIDGLGHITAVTTATYLTAEADTLGTVTSRGASTATASTFSGGLTASGATAITLSNATANVISTGTDVATSIQTRSSSTASTGSLSLFTGDSTFATGTGGLVNIYAGSSATASGSNVSIKSGNTTAATSTAGNVSIIGGTATSTATTAGTGGDIYIYGGTAIAAAGVKKGGNVYLDGGEALNAGTNTAGTVNIGIGQGTGFNGNTSAVNIGKTGITTTVTGIVKLPTVGTSGVVRLGTGGQLSADTTVAVTTGTLGQFASTTSLQLAGVISDETGTGALVFASSPTLVTPVIGAATGTSLAVTGSLTSRPATTNDAVIISGRAGGTGTWGVTLTPAALTASRTVTLPDGDVTLAAGTMAVTGGKLSQFAATTSAELAGVISDETGSGALVFADSPTLVTPVLGTPASGTLTNCTFPTLNQNTTGTAAGLSATLVASSGGTGQSSYAIGDILYASTTTALSKLADVATGNALISGGVATAPSWGKIALDTHVSNTLPVANGGTGQTSLQAAINSLAGAVTAAQFLRGNGSNVVMSAIAAADVPTLNQNTTGSAATLTTARTIGGVSFNGSANINLPGVNTAGNQNTSGTAATASALTTANSYTMAGLTVNGAISATGNITAYSSDSRLKTNVVAIPNALEKMQQIGGYSFDWDLEKCETIGFKPEQQHEHGVLAQEIQQVLPDVVVQAAFDKDYLTVRYERIVPLLIEAIKELNDKVNSLQDQLNSK